MRYITSRFTNAANDRRRHGALGSRAAGRALGLTVLRRSLLPSVVWITNTAWLCFVRYYGIIHCS